MSDSILLARGRVLPLTGLICNVPAHVTLMLKIFVRILEDHASSAKIIASLVIILSLSCHDRALKTLGKVKLWQDLKIREDRACWFQSLYIQLFPNNVLLYIVLKHETGCF